VRIRSTERGRFTRSGRRSSESCSRGEREKRIDIMRWFGIDEIWGSEVRMSIRMSAKLSIRMSIRVSVCHSIRVSRCLLIGRERRSRWRDGDS
jgi:hypothetical protein